MKKVSKIVMGVLIFILSVSAFGKGKIYVGTNAEFPPFEYLQDGKIVGFDIDLINAIGKEINKDIVIKDMAFDGLIPALQMNKVDIVIAGMTASEDRKAAVNFSSPYYEANQVIILNENNKDIKGFKDLNGKIVGVVLGFTGDLVISEMKDVNSKKYNASYGAIMELQNNKIDAVVLDSQTAINYVKHNKGIKLCNSKGDLEEYAIAISKNNPKLLAEINKAIEELKKNGTYDKLIEKYM